MLDRQHDLFESRLDDLCREARGIMESMRIPSHTLVEEQVQTSISVSVIAENEFKEDFKPSNMPASLIVCAVQAED